MDSNSGFSKQTIRSNATCCRLIRYDGAVKPFTYHYAGIILGKRLTKDRWKVPKFICWILSQHYPFFFSFKRLVGVFLNNLCISRHTPSCFCRIDITRYGFLYCSVILGLVRYPVARQFLSTYGNLSANILLFSFLQVLFWERFPCNHNQLGFIFCYPRTVSLVKCGVIRKSFRFLREALKTGNDLHAAKPN